MLIFAGLVFGVIAVCLFVLIGLANRGGEVLSATEPKVSQWPTVLFAIVAACCFLARCSGRGVAWSLLVVALTLGAQRAVLADSAPLSHEVPIEPMAPHVDGHPLTSVVVTQCNLIVAVYMTMPDGRLLRFDKSANIPSEQLMTMAYSATRSERVEVDCNGAGGAVGYEKHDPV